MTTTESGTTHRIHYGRHRRAPRTQRPETRLHRRGSRRAGIPRLQRERAPLQLLQAGEAQADPLRGRHRRGAARPAALPVAGLDLRLRGRLPGLPADLDQAQGLGRGQARARARHRFRRPAQELRVAGARLARVPRPQRGVGTHDLPVQRERCPADQPERRERPPGQGVRHVDAELGAVRGAQRRRVDAHRAHPGPVRVRRLQPLRPDEHAQHRDGGQQRAQDPVRAGPRAVQPDAVRGDRGLRRGRAHRGVELRRRVAGRPCRVRGAHRRRGRLGRVDLRDERACSSR